MEAAGMVAAQAVSLFLQARLAIADARFAASAPPTYAGGMDAEGKYHNKDGSLYSGPLTAEGYPSATNAE